MTTTQKCEAIVKKIVELSNEGRKVSFECDFGGYTSTIYVGNVHTHVGVPEGSFSLLIDNLYDVLHGGPGLSWA